MPPNLPTHVNWPIVIPIAISVLSAIIAGISLSFTRKSNRRAEQLFGSQLRPLVQEQPTALEFDLPRSFATIHYQVVNYSGFDAHDVVSDMRFGSNAWIVQWARAYTFHLQQQELRTPQEEQYLRQIAEEPWRIALLRAGDRAGRQMAFSLSQDYVCNEPDGIDVLVRTTWQNERGHAFDRIRKFRLLGTRVNTGVSYTFVPQGIVAQDE